MSRTPRRTRRVLTITPTGASALEAALLEQALDPERCIADRALARVSAELALCDPHERAHRRALAAEALLSDALLIEAAWAVVQRVSRDTRLPPNLVRCHAAMGLRAAAETLAPERLPAVAVRAA